MNVRWPVFLLILAVLLGGLVSPVRADGIIIPPVPPCPGDCPPFPRPIAQLDIRYHHVTVTIQDQLAVTRVDQVFYNPNDWAVEGTYIFPLPKDAAVTEFTLWVDGEPVKGEVLDAEEARRIYNETVQNLRDPALLEYEGRGAVKASVFPIPPQGERRIELEYSQVLTAENGLVRYIYPLNTEKFSRVPLEEVSVRVEVRDRQSIRAVYSPSHPVALDRRDDHHVIAGYEETSITPDQDFALYYSLGESEAFHIFSYRDPSALDDSDGFFMLLLAPKPEQETQPIAKDVLLVLDRSGSMEGVKFQQAQAALRYILGKLNPGDRFYLETFSTAVEPYASGLRSADEASEAIAWVDRLSASGSTDINRALLEAVAVMDRERPTYLIFLTDGLPTEGVTDTQQILDNFSAAAPGNLRMFAFGVGYDVDTVLLDTLSQEHHGLSTYVSEEQALDEVLSTFYERISTPVLTNLSLDFGGLAVYDVYPNPLPDLFSGSQVIVVGRYRGGGTADMVLRGEVNGASQEFRYPQQVFATDSRANPGSTDLIPRLWATRKIGYLLNEVRLKGPDKETIAQIVRLSVRYGIVTPYTSYLVTEPMPLGGASQEQIASDAYNQAQSAPGETFGKAAVERAAQEGQMQGAQIAPPASGGTGGTDSGEPGAAIRVVGSRTFVYQDETWVDTAFDPQATQAQQVVFLSDAYFDLLAARPDLVPALALGDQVTVMVGGEAYQVVREGEPGAPVKLPEVLPTGEPSLQPAGQSTATPQAVSAGPTTAPVSNPPESKPTGPCAAGLIPLAVAAAAAIFRLRKAG